MSTDTAHILRQFKEWVDDAWARSGQQEPTAMSLATATKDGIPSVRIVLLKAYDEHGFVFYTNLGSRKSRELMDNDAVGLCLHWDKLGRQIRVEGRVSPVSDSEADAYFTSRPRESQLGAWASKQSDTLADRAGLEQALAEVTKRFEGKPVPRPPFWGGWRVVPQAIEFWQDEPHRLHRREYYTRRADGNWDLRLLYP